MVAMPPGVQEKMQKLFRTAYYVASQARPFTDFASLILLQNKNGAALGDTYANDHKCREFISFFDAAFTDDLKEAIDESTFISILCNGSTDSGVLLS